MSFLTKPLSLNLILGQDRQIGPLTGFITTGESTQDVLTITKHPVQQGAAITDHAFKEPTSFSTTIYAQDNLFTSLSELYQQFLDLQASRVPFDIVTPKRVYKSMLFSALGQTTDRTTENTLALSCSFMEVIIVSVGVVVVPRLNQRNPGATGATQKAGKKSALQSLKEGIGGLF